MKFRKDYKDISKKQLIYLYEDMQSKAIFLMNEVSGVKLVNFPFHYLERFINDFKKTEMTKHRVKDFIQSVSETTAKDVILEELNEQGHLVMVEDVIFWALEFYVENYDKGFPSNGKAVAHSIVRRIKSREGKQRDRQRWSRG